MTNVEKMAKILEDECVTEFSMYVPSISPNATDEETAGEFLRMYENMKKGETIKDAMKMEFF